MFPESFSFKKKPPCYNEFKVRQPNSIQQGGVRMDNNSLSHTKWTCKYHIVFASKFRRKVVYKQIRADIGHILSELCKRKGVEIIAAECMPDYVHMFAGIPPKYSVSEIMGYEKKEFFDDIR